MTENPCNERGDPKQTGSKGSLQKAAKQNRIQNNKLLATTAKNNLTESAHQMRCGIGGLVDHGYDGHGEIDT